MQITYLGHASILVRCGATSLVMDPWLVDPIYCNSWFHYPPAVHTMDELTPLDYVWCSHDHPDHFDPATLRSLPRDQKFLVPQFASGRLQRELSKLGFDNQIPLEFGRTLQLGDDLEVTCLRTDLVWEDSALVVHGGGTTLFDMNDCKLGDELLAEVGQRFAPDIAFVPFSGAIHFPTCYDYDEERLVELCRKRRHKHLEWFVHRIELLGAPYAVPFAGNFALLHRDQLWMNEPDKNNINTPDEAVALLAERLPDVTGLQMNPGDRWTLEGGLQRHAPAPNFADKMAELRPLAERWAPDLERLRAAEPPARPSLRDDFRRFFGGIAERHPELPGRIAARVVFETDGPHGGRWCLDYSAAGLAIGDFEDGQDWNLWMHVPPSVLQQAVDGAVCWDEVAISFRVRFRENPEFFNRDFWVMLYNSEPAFLGSYLADPEPRF